MVRIKSVFIIFFTVISASLRAQFVPVHIYNSGVNAFVDEIANEGIIDINSVIKPYGRNEIAGWLLKADSLQSQLNKRQQYELGLYLDEFDDSHRYVRKTAWAKKGNGIVLSLLPPVFRYNDKKSSFIFRPVAGYEQTIYDGLPFYQRYWGAEMFFTIGKWSFYSSLRDYYQQREVTAMPGYLVPDPGGNYKINNSGRAGGDYSEMRGGFFYSWKWGRIGLVKDHVQWGDNYNGSTILSGRNPSFPMIQLQMKPFKWIDFQYFHGWLVSEVIDSSTSYYSQPGRYRGIYQPKYMAANMLTIIPWKKFHISLGNSIIYSDKSLMPVYLIPILFYKSVDHTINHGISNENSQMFLNISTRNLKHMHFYTTLFIDEFSIRRISDKNRYNFFAMRWGAGINNWPLKNLSFTGEYTQVFPIVYKHNIPSLTYASNQYNLGYYSGDNSTDLNITLGYKLPCGVHLDAYFGWLIHGIDHQYVLGTNADINGLLTGGKTFERNRLGLNAGYFVTAALIVNAGVEYSKTTGYAKAGHSEAEYLEMYTPSYLWGEKLLWNFGFKYGF